MLERLLRRRRRPNSGGRAAAVSLLVAGMCVAAGTARAGRPLVTDDADVLDAHACEWESYAARLRDGATATAWQTAMTCGLPAALQLSGTYGRSRSGADHVDTVGLGGKLQLMGADSEAVDGTSDGNRTRIAVSANLNALRVGNAGFELQDQNLNLIASRSLSESWTLHLNLGWDYSRAARRSSTLWATAIEAAIGGNVDIVGEWYGDDRSPPWLGTGLRWSPVPSASFNASYGVRRGGETARLATLGCKFAF